MTTSRTATCVGGPLDGQTFTSRFPRGVLVVNRPAGAADVDAIADAVVERLNHLGLTDQQKTDVRVVVSDVLLHGAATPPVPTE